MKLGCIGYGNMATAILGGLAQKKLLPAGDVFVYDPNGQKLEEAAANGFFVAHSEGEIIKNADMVLLAVKPKDFPSLFKKIADEENAEKVTFVSIAAGITIQKIIELLGKQAPVVR
ncbi:MAG: pyrroline-5-carboxylate reductase family protein, partial [Oscillospiraceae bacterium]